MSQVAFARRGDLVRSLHSKVDALTTQIEAAESEIRSVQHEQCVRADQTQTRHAGYAHPHSAAGRKGIKACKDRIKALRSKVSRLVQQRATVRTEARFQESIVEANTRPVRTKTPMRNL